jgi:hypothetical protein
MGDLPSYCHKAIESLYGASGLPRLVRDTHALLDMGLGLEHLHDTAVSIVGKIFRDAAALASQTRRAPKPFRDLDGIAFEIIGASPNWYWKHGHFSEAAVVIWTARLCCAPPGRAAGFDTALTGLRDYILLVEPAPIGSLIADVSMELMKIVSWYEAFFLVELLCVLEARSGTRSARESVYARVHDDDEQNRLARRRAWRMWLDSRDRQLNRSDKDNWYRVYHEQPLRPSHTAILAAAESVLLELASDVLAREDATN